MIPNENEKSFMNFSFRVCSADACLLVINLGREMYGWWAVCIPILEAPAPKYPAVRPLTVACLPTHLPKVGM